MEGAATTVMETLTKAVGDVFTLMGTCFTQITSCLLYTSDAADD